MTQLRIGIIGTGGMAHWHARQYNESGCCEIVAVCDVDRARAESFARMYNAPQAYEDYRAMISAGGIEAISVVTSNDAHHPIAMAALDAKLHVMCEKPLAMNAQQAQEMRDAAHAAGVIHAVNFTHRNAPCFALARKFVAGGYLGDPYHVQADYLQDWLLVINRSATPSRLIWRMDSRVAGSGELGDLGAHVIDLLHGLLGDVSSVSALLPSFAGLHASDSIPQEQLTDDVCALLLQFRNGAVGHVTTSRVATGMGDTITFKLYGREGAILADDRKPMELQACLGKPGIERRTWTTYIIAEREREPNPLMLFIEGINTGIQPAYSFDDGLRVQRVIDAAIQSSRGGQRQSVD